MCGHRWLPEPSLTLLQEPPARGQARRTRVPCSQEQQKWHVEAQVEGHPIGPTSLSGKGMGTGTGWANSHSTRCSWAPAAARETPSQTVTCTWLARKGNPREVSSQPTCFVIDVAFQKHYKAAQLILPWLSPNGCVQQRQQHSEVLGALQSQLTQRAPLLATHHLHGPGSA